MRFLTVILVGAILCVSGCQSALAQDPVDGTGGGVAGGGTPTASQLARDGRGLSVQQVNELEDQLLSTPDDMAARTRLLGYYYFATDAVGRDSETCQLALGSLTAKQAIEETNLMLDSSCPGLYRMGWLDGSAAAGRGQVSGCPEAYNAINDKGALRDARAFISNQCWVAGPEESRPARRRHILWIIEHHPEHDVTMLSEFTIDPDGHRLADADGYEQAKELWLDQVDQHDDDARVLMHAARFFGLSDKALGLTYLKQAVELEPDDREIAAWLGSAYAVTALGITMINNNGLPMSADPAEAADPVAETAIDELRTSSNPVVIAQAGKLLSQYGAMVRATTEGAINRDALAEELLLRAAELYPNDPDPASSLGQFYKGKLLSLRATGTGSSEERAELARKSLEQAETVVDRTTGDRGSHVRALRTASKAAVDAEAFDQAQRFATELLMQIADPPDVRDGPSFHDGHVVLGLVVLEDGDVEQAKVHLLQAGRTPGGGTLTSFGPNMLLADELAERGERDTVVAYLEMCRSFWPNPRLEQWIQTLNDGEVPDFGANLVY